MPALPSDVRIHYFHSSFYLEAKWTESFRNKTMHRDTKLRSTRFCVEIWFGWNVGPWSGTHRTFDWDKTSVKI